MEIQKKRDFLTNLAYWAVIAAGVYLGFEYLLPISVPFIFGTAIAWAVVWLSRKLHCTHKVFRLCLTVLVYGIIGLLISLLAVKTVSGITGIIQWLPRVYENKLLPFATLIYEWFVRTIAKLDPALLGALEMLLEGVLSGLKNLISSLSSAAVNLVSGLATGVPNLVLSLLAMVFCTIFVVADYEQIYNFTQEYVPAGIRQIITKIRLYLTNTLFIVIRSYILIMLLTFAELSLLFSVFRIPQAFLKAAIIAVFDVMPILGTGGIMIPWFVISFALGHTAQGLKLLIIYAIVTVVRNYVEPKIVGAQLGLHPIITLVSMFIGLRLFGFWGLFGLPVGISFLWKEKQAAKATS